MSFFENRVYAITGATSGIGQAVAVELAKNGARVLALGRNEEKLKNLLNNLEGKNHSYRLFDSNELETCEETIKSGVEEMGKLSGFVHSAGISGGGLLRDIDFNKLHEILQINLVCFFAFAKAVCKMGRYEKGNMSVVALSSVAAFIKNSALSVYGASKAGIKLACEDLAYEYLERGVRFNSIAPGYVKTPMVFRANEIWNKEEKVLLEQPLGMIEPSEVADIALFLLSNRTSKVTGACIKIGGGL